MHVYTSVLFDTQEADETKVAAGGAVINGTSGWADAADDDDDDNQRLATTRDTRRKARVIVRELRK